MRNAGIGGNERRGKREIILMNNLFNVDKRRSSNRTWTELRRDRRAGEGVATKRYAGPNIRLNMIPSRANNARRGAVEFAVKRAAVDRNVVRDETRSNRNEVRTRNRRILSSRFC